MEAIYSPLDQDLDTVPAVARVGLLALASDFCLEDHLRFMLPEGFQVYTNRITNQIPLTFESLTGMEHDIARAAGALLPGGAPDCFIYGCTSGTAAIGYDNIVRHIRTATGQDDVPVITPLTAGIDALHAVGAKNISILTPYTEDISQDVAENFAGAGFTVDRHSYLSMTDDYDVYRVPLDVWRRAAVKAVHPNSDALFISCTSTRASLILSELEEILKIPVLASNQTLAYGTITAMKQPLNIKGYGGLLAGDYS